MTVKPLDNDASLYSEEELHPQTGQPRECTSSAVEGKLSKTLPTLMSIFVQNPAHRAVFAAFDSLRLRGIATKGQRQYGVRNAAPTGSGKSTVAEAYKAYVLRTGSFEPEAMPVIVVSLERACTMRRLWSSILRTIGDGFWDKGSEDNLRKRAYAALTRLKCELLIIDEIQHLAFRSSERNDVTDGLKRVLDDGVVPLALVGMDDAKSFLEGNKQLSMRLMPPCDIRPLNPLSEADQEAFGKFIGLYDDELLKAKLVRKRSDLDDERTIACLLDISQGVLGQAVFLIHRAYERSFRRDADLIEVCDLSRVTDTWAVAQGVVARNPFVHGPRPIK